MKFGIHFPHAEIPSDPAVIRDYLQTVEGLGFQHLNVSDHVVQTRTARVDHPAAPHYTTAFPNHEAMTLIAFAAAVTETILFKTAILILPQRQAALVAKQAAQIDVLSGGRMQLGVGLGWNEPEYDALDMKFNNRGKRMEEQLDFMRKLWLEQHVTYEGKWHRIEDAGLAPMPVQRPIPVWMGAIVPKAVERVARIGNGWQIMIPAPDEAAAKSLEEFRGMVRAAGREESDVGIEATIFSPDSNAAAWRQQIEAWRSMGVTHIVFRPMCEFEQHQDMVAAFAEVMTDYVAG